MQAISSNTIPTSLMFLWLRIWSKFLEPGSKIYWQSFQEVWVLFRQHINVYGFVMRYSTIKYGCNVWLSTCFLPCSVAISLHGALCNLFFPQHSPTYDLIHTFTLQYPELHHRLWKTWVEAFCIESRRVSHSYYTAFLPDVVAPKMT